MLLRRRPSSTVGLLSSAFRSLFLFLLPLSSFAATVSMEFEPRWAGKPIAIPSAAVDNQSGQRLRITRLSGLVSGVTLTRDDGSTVQLSGQYGFIDAGNSRLAVRITDVAPGRYVGIGFEFGLPPAINHADPGRWPAGHPLNPLVDHLHWDWQGGYVFLALEGHWTDGAGAGAADEDAGFSYHLAGDRHIMPIRFAAMIPVRSDTTVRFALELSKLLAARRLAVNDDSQSTHSGPGDQLASDLAAAVRRAFFFLGAAPTAAEPVPARERASAGFVPSASTHPLAFEVPRGFPAPDLPADNPLTSEGVELGRALFNDRRLSGNGRQACADCHAPNHAFSDTVALSRGADGKPGARNAMPLFNLAWAGSYAWDGSKPRIRDQAIAAMTNPVEMHGRPSEIARRLRTDPALLHRFAAAFGTAEVTLERIGLALEQYLLTSVSADSKFDRAIRGEATLTEEEKEGFALFQTEYDPARGRRGADCFHCHGGPLFTDYDFKNNGLDRVARDLGRQVVSGRASDAGKFKTPSLRNVAVTGPYMHDGRFATLEQVVAHYDHGVIRSPNLDPNLAKHPADGMKLTSAEQRALVAFLRTLTDPRLAVSTEPKTAE